MTDNPRTCADALCEVKVPSYRTYCGIKHNSQEKAYKLEAEKNRANRSAEGFGHHTCADTNCDLDIHSDRTYCETFHDDREQLLHVAEARSGHVCAEKHCIEVIPTDEPSRTYCFLYHDGHEKSLYLYRLRLEEKKERDAEEINRPMVCARQDCEENARKDDMLCDVHAAEYLDCRLCGTSTHMDSLTDDQVCDRNGCVDKATTERTEAREVATLETLQSISESLFRIANPLPQPTEPNPLTSEAENEPNPYEDIDPLRNDGLKYRRVVLDDRFRGGLFVQRSNSRGFEEWEDKEPVPGPHEIMDREDYQGDEHKAFRESYFRGKRFRRIVEQPAKGEIQRSDSVDFPEFQKKEPLSERWHEQQFAKEGVTDVTAGTLPDQDHPPELDGKEWDPVAGEWVLSYDAESTD